MNTLIVYTTQFGCTEKCVNKLSGYLSGKTEVINLKNNPAGNLKEYDTIIIGGPITAGKINPKIKKFCDDNLLELLKKKIGLFICAGWAEYADKELKDNFPEELFRIASAIGYFGYEFNFEKMNFLLRAMMKKMSKTDQSVSNILDDNIKEFAKEIEK